MLLRRRGGLIALNRRHFAAKGANFLAVSNGGPTLYDIITRQPSTNTNAPTGARDPLIGNASTFANNTKLSFAGRGTTAYTACTWAVLFKYNTLVSNAVRTICADGVTPGTTGSVMRVSGVVGGGALQFRPNGSSLNGALNLVSGGYYFGLASFSQAASGNNSSVVTRRLDTNELDVVTGNSNVAPVPGGTITIGDVSSASTGGLMDICFVFQSHNYTPLKQLIDWSADPFSIFEDDQNDWLPLFSQTVTNVPTNVTLTQATWNWNTQLLTADNKNFVTLTQKAWNWSTQLLQIGGTTNVTLISKSWNWSTQLITADAKTFITLIQKPWNWSTQLLTADAQTFITLVQKSWSWSTQLLSINAKRFVTLTTQTWNWTGNQLPNFGSAVTPLLLLMGMGT